MAEGTTRISITADIIDQAAKVKLDQLDHKVDNLKAKKISITTDVDDNALRKVTQLTDGVGYLTTVTEIYDKKTHELKSTTVQQTQDFEKQEKAARKLAEAEKKAAKEAEELSNKEKKAASETEELGEKTEKTTNRTNLLSTAFMRLAQVLISSVSRAFRESLTEMKNVDSQLVVISRVTQKSLDDLTDLRDKAYEVGQAYGILASDFLSSAAAFTRAGYREQAEDLAELSSKLQMAAGVSADTANQLLITMDVAYGLKGSYEDLSKVMDEMIVIDHNYATSVQKIADGMGIIAPIAAQTHVSAEELAAAIGTITATTQRSGTEAARAFRAIALNIIGDTKTEIEDGVTWTAGEIDGLRDVLKLYAKDVVDAAEATGKVINPMEAIGALAQSYKEGVLTEAELMSMVSDIGGKLRASQLMALIQNWEMYNDMLRDTQDAVGAVDKDIEKALESWDVKLNQLKNTITEFFTSLLDTKEIKGFIDAINYLIKSIDNPDEYSELFIQTLENAFNSLVEKLPRLQEVINRLAITVIKGIAKSAADNLPEILKSLAVGARDATRELAKNEPEIFRDIAKIIAEAIASAILDFNLAFDITDALIEGIITSIPQALIGFGEGLVDAFSNGFEDGFIEFLKRRGGIIGRLLEETETGKKNTRINTNGLGVDLGSLKGHSQEAAKAIEEVADALEDSEEATDKQLDSLNGLTDELTSATAALQRYKDALEGGEKGDTFKSYAEAYKEAVELFEKGLTGSNKYMAAIDLLIPEDVMRDLEWSYEEAGKLLGNDFIRAMFESGGDDYGANAANYIREHIEEFKGVAIEALDDGTFNLAVTDMDAFAESTGLTADALWALMDALDIYHSKTTYTFEDLQDLINKYSTSVGNLRNVNVPDVLQGLIKEGRTDREINDIIESLRKLSETDPTIKLVNDPADLTETLDSLRDINEEAEKNPDLEVTITSNKEEFFDDLYKECQTFDGTIYIGIKYKDTDVGSASSGRIGGGSSGAAFSSSGQAGGGSKDNYISVLDNGSRLFSGRGYASGTRRAAGGLALVNEKGAELIVEKGSARIAGGGNPAVTNIQKDATVYNAEETSRILRNSDVTDSSTGTPNRGYSGTPLDSGAVAANIPISSWKSGTSGGSSSGSSSKDKLSDIFDDLDSYVDDLLKKAKQALDAQTKAIDEQIDALKAQHNADEDANELEELRLKILEAEKDLVDAQFERTVRYFNKATGQWEWMADQKAVAEAQKALEEAQKKYDEKIADMQYEADIQALKDQKQSLKDAYTELKDNWDNISDAIDAIVNGKDNISIVDILAQLGLTAAASSAGDVKSLLSAISSYEQDIANGKYNPSVITLDEATTNAILSGSGYSSGASAKSILSMLFGVSKSDIGATGSSTLTTSTSSVIGDTIYYINGVRIGNDMMNRPLSEILSVLPIYAN